MVWNVPASSCFEETVVLAIDNLHVRLIFDLGKKK